MAADDSAPVTHPPPVDHAAHFGHTEPSQAAPAAAYGDLPGLVVDRIGKSFGGRQVVKDVSLTLRRGQVAGLLGPNGAGKTTCFYMITGLIPADYGAIYLDGE
ncbi:MAG TPA: ATP-binding cassette domain-containing protein, partial [Caulobacteraceae bacterium]|nr:ATP-binding cassette domain-containing protein [Caulobacteraceae bacterium]